MNNHDAPIPLGLKLVLIGGWTVLILMLLTFALKLCGVIA